MRREASKLAKKHHKDVATLDDKFKERMTGIAGRFKQLDEEQAKHELVLKEVEALHRVFTKNPIFGVAFDKKEGLGKDGPLDGSLADGRTPRLEDDVEIEDAHAAVRPSALLFTPAAPSSRCRA